MITEDYCSQEVVKLLRAKGFPVGVGSWSRGFVWDGEGYAPGPVKHENSITHQMAMKWLREKGFSIEPLSLSRPKVKAGFGFSIADMETGLEIYGEGSYPEPVPYDTYEAAVEAALKYALENLI